MANNMANNMANLSQLRITITPVDPFFDDQLSFIDQSGNQLLGPPYYISNDGGNEPSEHWSGNGYTLYMSGSNPVNILIDATVSNITTVCTNPNIYWGDYGNIVVEVTGIYDDTSEQLLGGPATLDYNGTTCIELASCFIASQLVVGSDYNVESEDGMMTGVFKITSIDSETCNVCFRIISGDWTTFDPTIHTNIKIFYGSNLAVDYCILNESNLGPGG